MIEFPALPAYVAQAAHIFWEPISGSGERITAAVALVDEAGEPRVVSLLNPEILSVLYRGQGQNAASLIALITESLKAHLRKAAEIAGWQPPVSGFFAQPMREYIGNSAEDILDQVAGIHSSLYKAKAPVKPEQLQSRSDGLIRQQVRDAAKRLYGLKADEIFTPAGIIEVAEEGRKRHLDIPIKTASKVGSIISVWYNTPATIETHFLRAQSNLAVAVERNKYEPGLFISVPDNLANLKNRNQIDNLIDDFYWRLKRTGCHLEVKETAEELARDIVEWAA